eukprot:CAMPEP_0113552214 /NCGR_PEP_ID=MMETSP0015_2-20120614/14944_1 /TAXON_ID=2838 /ORGANISM="Odontella" /LENGTH=218 /DNA_ID=CAMNT_0000453169 /DNA_START=198 /DNA_END=854 /DNA_ORIENTATION=- /assembly_acc=CAM_ASM_000160
MVCSESNDVPVSIMGGHMKTWKVDPVSQKCHVNLKTNGRPVNAEINLWHGPDYSPSLMKVWLEDGLQYPLNVVMNPKGHGIDTVQVQNTAQMEFPLTTQVGQGDGASGIYKSPGDLVMTSQPRLVQGAGAVVSCPIDTSVQRVQVGMHATEARNVKFILELLQGPNNVKQSIEFYASNGYKTPFYAVFDTPGSGYVVRIKNEYPLEFPINAYVEPFNG